MGKRIWWSKQQDPNRWDLPDDVFVFPKPESSDRPVRKFIGSCLILLILCFAWFGIMTLIWITAP